MEKQTQQQVELLRMQLENQRQGGNAPSQQALLQQHHHHHHHQQSPAAGQPPEEERRRRAKELDHADERPRQGAECLQEAARLRQEPCVPEQGPRGHAAAAQEQQRRKAALELENERLRQALARLREEARVRRQQGSAALAAQGGDIAELEQDNERLRQARSARERAERERGQALPQQQEEGASLGRQDVGQRGAEDQGLQQSAAERPTAGAHQQRCAAPGRAAAAAHYRAVQALPQNQPQGLVRLSGCAAPKLWNPTSPAGTSWDCA